MSATSGNTHNVPIKTLDALCALRDATPKLAEYLKPTPPPDQSGLILDWGIDMTKNETRPSFSDFDQRYWSSIAVFDENGCITELLLGRQRLQGVDENLLIPLLKNAVKLDLAGTMMPVNAVRKIFNHCEACITHLYVGGNSLGDDGFVPLVAHLPKTLHLLDARYNDLGERSAKALGNFLKNSSDCEKLYLEGNMIGDAGATFLSHTGFLRELYLGQNQIGAAGAAALAEGLHTGCLQKLYLEGNNIGPDGAISFRVALEEMGPEKKLKHLYVENNEIGKTEAMKLGEALQSGTMIGGSLC